MYELSSLAVAVAFPQVSGCITSDQRKILLPLRLGLPNIKAGHYLLSKDQGSQRSKLSINSSPKTKAVHYIFPKISPVKAVCFLFP